MSGSDSSPDETRSHQCFPSAESHHYAVFKSHWLVHEEEGSRESKGGGRMTLLAQLRG